MKQIEDDKTIDMIDVYDHEEAHYVHTINDVVELMIVYGFDAVMDDVLVKLGDINK